MSVSRCPYCNSDQIRLDSREEYIGDGETKKYYWVICLDCHARSGRSDIRIQAILAWNTLSDCWYLGEST